MDSTQPAFLGNKRFELRGRLGTGAVGEVHRAFDKETNTWVALKILLKKDSKKLRNFKKEFLFASSFDHPNLVRFYEFFEEEDRCFFSMELIEGDDFLSYVRPSQSSFDEKKLRHCLTQAASGVVELHRHGTVHRDLKPANVLVDNTGRLVILDFGIAAEVVAGLQIDDIDAVGTVAYMAPEQSTGVPISAAADWYAIGTILYQSLTGKLPFEGSHYKILANRQMFEPLPPNHYVPDAPPDLISLCEDLLRYDPKARPNGKAVLDRLGFQRSGIPQKIPIDRGAEITEESIPFVGREQEIQSLFSALLKSRTGSPECVFIWGDAGEGKTALAREFLSQARSQNDNTIVFSGKFLKNSSLRFQVFEDIVSDLSDRLINTDLLTSTDEGISNKDSNQATLTSREAAAVTQVFPSLLGVRAISKTAGFLTNKIDPGAVRTLAFQTVRKLLCILANRHSLVLFIDDLQWAKTDSLDLLREILYPDEAQPLALLLVATVRTDSKFDLSLKEVFPSRKELYLDRLPDENVFTLCREIFRIYDFEVPSNEKLLTLAKEARGHPLFVAELVRHVMRGEKVTAGGLEEIIWSRVQTLEKETQFLLELISLAGVPLNFHALAEIADIDITACRRIVSHLLVHNLVKITGGIETESIEPYHDRIHEVITDRIDEEKAKHHHQRIAYSMRSQNTGFDQALVVAHLEKAGAFKEAGELAERAAEKAANSMAFGQVVNLLRKSLRLGEHTESRRQEILMKLGDALCTIGNGAEASQAYLSARQAADLATRFSLWRRAAQHLILAGQFKEGINELRLLLAEIGEGFSKTRLWTLVLLLWRRTLIKLRGLQWKDKTETNLDPSSLIRIDVYQVVAEILGLVDVIQGAEYQARTLFTALRVGERNRIVHAFLIEALFVSSQGTQRAFRRARNLIERAKKLATKYSILHMNAQVKANEGALNYFEGHLKTAEQFILEAVKEFEGPAQGSVVLLNNTRLFSIYITRFAGEFEKLKKLSETYLREAERRGDMFMVSNIRYLRSQIWLAQDLPEEANRDLTAVKWSPSDGGYLLLDWYATLARGEIALYEGTVIDEMEFIHRGLKDLAKSLLLRVGVLRAESSFLKGRILLAAAALSPPEVSRKYQREAIRLTRKLTTKKTGFRLAKVWAPILRAAIADQKGDREASINYLKTAITEAEDKDTPQLAAAARRRLGQILGGSEGADMLSKGDKWMNENGIVNYESMTEVFAPGFKSITHRL